MSILCLSEKLAQAERTGCLPKVVIPVHMCGSPCDMEAIYLLAQRYKFGIIEDASHAIGASYKGTKIGSCQYSDITVFSFHPVKIITTGEGGMALTKDSRIATRMRLLRSHGITSTPLDMLPRSKEEIWNYQQIELGFNYRITDFQAALGLSQFQRLDEFVVRRNAIAERYSDALAGFPVTFQRKIPAAFSSFHLFVIRLRLDEIKSTHRLVYESLRASGIHVNLHYIPVYRHPFYENMGFVQGYCPQAENYYSEAISIPMYPGLTVEKQDRVICALDEAISK